MHHMPIVLTAKDTIVAISEPNLYVMATPDNIQYKKLEIKMASYSVSHKEAYFNQQMMWSDCLSSKEIG